MFAFKSCSFKLHKISIAIHSNIIQRQRVIGHVVAYYNRSYSKLPVVSVRATPVIYSETATVTHTTDTTKADDTNNNDFAIDHQKERAIQYWNESKSKYTEALKEQVHDDVIQHLQEGKVIPIFHTLCRPPTERLFTPNTRVSTEDPNSDIIQLSSDPVTMGECNEELDLVGKLSMDEEMSYISAFFDNDNKGRLKVFDRAMQWSFSHHYTKIVTDLVNAPADMVGEDIEVTELIQPFAVDKKSGNNLITRRLSRGVVADCFAKSELGSTYAIVGNPGIGKSWTLIYALQQALLYENVCVLFCMQKDGIAMVCLRRNNKIYVWQSNDDRWGSKCSSSLFRNSNVLVLLDPLEASKGGASYVEGLRMLIMAASNNAIHFKSTRKFTPDFPRILGPPTEKELKVIIPFTIGLSISPELLDEILQRAKVVGNLLRYILSKMSFDDRLAETSDAVKRLETREMEEILNFNGISRLDLAGCIFVLNVQHDLISAPAEGKQFSKPDSSLTQYDGKVSKNAGYDGQCIPDYGKRAVTVMSEHVNNLITTYTTRT